jgi:Lipopolysaccharide-assembly
MSKNYVGLVGGQSVRVTRRWIAGLAACSCLALSSCTSDGQITIFGYTTKPNYDTSIHTVRVPIFKNNTYWRGLEFDLTRAVVREVESKTPFKVVGEGCSADTELTGAIVVFNKNILNRTQYNEVREGETVLAVEVYWRDLRSGQILSQPRPPNGPPPLPTDTPPTGLAPPRVLVQSLGHYIPEVGQSLATAEQENVNRLAVQIVSMMEIPW